ncbi:MAG: hypothetical protein RL659_417, partial [Pseudomonadota bacterium]
MTPDFFRVPQLVTGLKVTAKPGQTQAPFLAPAQQTALAHTR